MSVLYLQNLQEILQLHMNIWKTVTPFEVVARSVKYPKNNLCSLWKETKTNINPIASNLKVRLEEEILIKKNIFPQFYLTVPVENPLGVNNVCDSDPTKRKREIAKKA